MILTLLLYFVIQLTWVFNDSHFSTYEYRTHFSSLLNEHTIFENKLDPLDDFGQSVHFGIGVFDIDSPDEFIELEESYGKVEVSRISVDG
jgi:hypothetical protein